MPTSKTKTWTIQSILAWSTDYFADISACPRVDAEWILSHVLQLNRLDLYLQFQQPLNSNELADYKKLVRRRKKAEPIQYILGKAPFYQHLFSVTPDVLIPRYDTERLIDIVCAHVHPDLLKTIIDVGTGSGAIAITLKSLYPESTVFGCDISEKALAIAKENGLTLKQEVNWVISDYLSYFRKDINIINDKQTLIVSNPPYIASHILATLPSEVHDYEPKLALDGGNNGLQAYYQIITDIQAINTPVTIVWEHGFDQQKELIQLLEKNSFSGIQHFQDYGQRDRIILAKYQPQ